MSTKYKILALKYRPNKFTEIIGQDIAVRTITTAIIKNRISNAFILSGVRGVGKTTIARLIASSLNCMERKTDDPNPCGHCSNCESIARSENIDVLEVDAASKTGIDDIRDIIETIKYSPTGGQYKIYIIDEVHMLSKQAFNGLLKTLEEPPQFVKFIFATTEVKKIPLTVLSRCQRFDLKRVNFDQLINFIKKVSKKENVEIDSESLALIARISEGSVRDSLSILDQAISFSGNNVNKEKIQSMLGLVDRIFIIELFELIISGNAEEALNKLKNSYDNGIDLKSIIESLLETVYFLSRIKVSKKELNKDFLLSDLEHEKLLHLVKKLEMPYLIRSWQILVKGSQELANAPIQLSATEMIIIKLAYVSNLPTIDKIYDQLDSAELSQVEKKVENKKSKVISKVNFTNPTIKNTVPETKPIKKNESKESVNKELEINSFDDFVKLSLKKRDLKFHHSLTNDINIEKFTNKHMIFSLKDHTNEKMIQDVYTKLLQWTGNEWVIELSESSSKITNDGDKSKSNYKVKKTLKDPFVEETLKIFPGSQVSTNKK